MRCTFAAVEVSLVDGPGSGRARTRLARYSTAYTFRACGPLFPRRSGYDRGVGRGQERARDRRPLALVAAPIPATGWQVVGRSGPGRYELIHGGTSERALLATLVGPDGRTYAVHGEWLPPLVELALAEECPHCVSETGEDCGYHVPSAQAVVKYEEGILPPRLTWVPVERNAVQVCFEALDQHNVQATMGSVLFMEDARDDLRFSVGLDHLGEGSSGYCSPAPSRVVGCQHCAQRCLHLVLADLARPAHAVTDALLDLVREGYVPQEMFSRSIDKGSGARELRWTLRTPWPSVHLGIEARVRALTRRVVWAVQFAHRASAAAPSHLARCVGHAPYRDTMGRWLDDDHTARACVEASLLAELERIGALPDASELLR